jgi:hypothetical protein
MKVFLSFSGDASRNIALALRDWLPKVIQAVKPFISEDIGKGERWSEELADALNQAEFGIICITKYNSNMPWINFEAGAISKAIPKAVHEPLVFPFLFGIDRDDISAPLQQFQTATADKEGVFRILTNLNNKLGEERLTNELLELEFEKWWCELQTKLFGIIDEQTVNPVPGLKGLYTADGLTKRQAEINCKQIWVITPDLYRRTIDPKVRDLLQRNIEHGVSYTFITVLSSKTAEAKRDLEQIFNAKPNSVRVIEYRESKIRPLAVTDYIIMNPDPDSEHPQYVFLELPVEQRGYWIEVYGGAALDFVNRFRRLVERKNT